MVVGARGCGVLQYSSMIDTRRCDTIGDDSECEYEGGMNEMSDELSLLCSSPVCLE